MTITGRYRVEIMRVIVILSALLLLSAKKQLFLLPRRTDAENRERRTRRIYILYYSNIAGSGHVFIRL